MVVFVLNTPPISRKNTLKNECNKTYTVIIISIHNGHGIIIDKQYFSTFNALQYYLMNNGIDISGDDILPKIFVVDNFLYEVYIKDIAGGNNGR